MEKIKKIFVSSSMAMNTGSCIILLLLMLLTVTNVVSRSFFNYPIFGTYEGVSYLSLLMAILAMPSCEMLNGNIRVTIITDYVPPIVRKILAIIDLSLSSIGSLFVTYKLFGLIFRQKASGAVSSDLKLPIYVFVCLIVLGFALLSLCLLLKLAQVIKTSANKPVEFYQETD